MNDLEIYQEYEKIRKKFKLPETINPCLMLLIGNKEKPRGDQAFILACELNRVGKQPKRIKQILDSLYISQSKINSILKSLKKTDYKYDCANLEERGLCVFDNRESCRWCKKSLDKNKKEWEEKDFYTYGWPKKLRRTEECLYRAIRAIEIRRGWLPGTRLFVSLDQLHEQSRVAKRIMTKKLKVLKKVGLIKYRRGDHRVKGSKARATQVQRIIPIPKPLDSQNIEQS